VKSISSEARKASVEICGDVAARATAIFGVSGHLRIIMSLLMRALSFYISAPIAPCASSTRRKKRVLGSQNAGACFAIR
jgi:hypothetical protein